MSSSRNELLNPSADRQLSAERQTKCNCNQSIIDLWPRNAVESPKFVVRNHVHSDIGEILLAAQPDVLREALAAQSLTFGPSLIHRSKLYTVTHRCGILRLLTEKAFSTSNLLHEGYCCLT
jgi:hypothetical protein